MIDILGVGLLNGGRWTGLTPAEWCGLTLIEDEERGNRDFSTPIALPVVTMETLGQTNQPSVTTWSPPLSHP